MELRELLAILRRCWISIVVCALLGTGAAAALSWNTTPVYTSQVMLFVDVQDDATADVGDRLEAASYVDSQITLMGQLVTSSIRLQPVIDRLGLDTTPDALAPMVAVDSPSSGLLEISVTHPSAPLAASIATELGNEVITATGTQSGPAGTPNLTASVVTPAIEANDASNDNRTLNLAVGFLVGLVVGLVQAVVRDLYDTRIRDERDVVAATSRQMAAVIPFDARLAKGAIVPHDPRSPLAEAYRRLRTRLSFPATGTPPRTLVVASALPGEGKTTTAINIAESLAEAGASVLLIDANLRAPDLARLLGMPGTVGLVTVLAGRATLGDAVQSLGSARPDVLTSGGVPANPAELLGSQAMEQLLNEAADAYDTVVLDSPPLLAVTDAAPLSALAQETLLVAGSGKIRAAQLGGAVAAIEQVGGSVWGVVLNKVRGWRPPKVSARAGVGDAQSMNSIPPAEISPVRPISAPPHRAARGDADL